MRHSNSRVCIIIVSYNRLDDLERCIISLEQTTSASDAVVVVDNDSEDKFRVKDFSQKYNDIHWILNRTNNGFTGGNHQGIRWAIQQGFEYLFLLNPDTEVFPDTMDQLLVASKEKKNQWILGPLLIKPDDHFDPVIDSAGLYLDRFCRAVDLYRGKKLSETDLTMTITPVKGLCGAAMLIPTRLFPLRKESPEAVFVEDYFAYFEDVEFSQFWRNQKGNFGICLNSRIKHNRGKQSELKHITFKKWRRNQFIVKKMILNRYRTIAHYKLANISSRQLILLIIYELLRWLYIAVKKPFLLYLLWPSWKILHKR